KLKLIRSNVNDVDYGALLAPYDVVIVFNRNSFDKKTTEQTLNKVKEACQGKTFFYVYSNPVFEASFAGHECVFAMQGWHKGWNTKVFKVS
ncbi:MAG TPA: hypothetical protein VLL76_11610, partial [Candidatus Omnitrophota bacterium]|nr:hypothetical protein [Candidatus Omnitrophota bacterium]